MVRGVYVFEQKAADEMRISDWSSDVFSSDLPARRESSGHRSPSAPPSRARRRRRSPNRQALAPHALAASPRRTTLRATRRRVGMRNGSSAGARHTAPSSKHPIHIPTEIPRRPIPPLPPAAHPTTPPPLLHPPE